MRFFLLGLAILMPLPMAIGCGGSSSAPALTQPGKDPPPEQQKNWMEESKKHGSGGGAQPGGAPK